VEAVHASGPGFAIGVQWHPEYDWERDEISRQIFVVFGEAVRARLAGPARLSAAD
jgi:putative glutamine amidotransferase